MVGLGALRGPVEIPAGKRLLDIAVKLPAAAHKPVVLRPVGGGAKKQPLFFKGSFQFPQNISFGSHIGGII